MTELEEKLNAKIPGDDTGIEIRHGMCDMCTPLCHCGVDCYVKDNRIIKIEGTKGHPMNDGSLCTKGAANRGFVYREDRITTPLRRVGPRGSGRFEPITWDEAYDEIAEKLLGARRDYGANSVMFYSGYAKWYRFMLQRLAFDFGSINYGTESSTCFTANRMAWITMTGKFARPDMMNAKLYLAWGTATHYSRWTNANNLDNFKRRGGTVICVDPRITPGTERDADLHLRLRPGTDGLLANCIAGIIIRRGWHDKEYIQKYVHGFEQYSEYVCSIMPEEAARVTGVSVSDIEKAAELIAKTKPMSLENSPGSIIHQTNGYQSARAIFALSVITGNYNRPGGNMPLDFAFCEQGAGFRTHDEEFAVETMPEGYGDRVGAKRFPVWAKLVTQCQCADLARQILEGTPYPIKAMFACGMNYRMFPGDADIKRALEKLDFFVDVDLFMTDSAKLADIVLPCCSSFEREEFKVYPGGFAKYYAPVIEPLGQCRDDGRIISELCAKLGIEDEYLLGGYRKCIERVLRGTGIDIDALIASPLPSKVPADIMMKPVPEGYVKGGCRTSSGKLELYSELIHDCGPDYEPLPKFEPVAKLPNEDYPLSFHSGVRIPNTIHSRLHNVPWARVLRPDAMADISIEDAARLGIERGDDIIITSDNASIRVKANPTAMAAPGQVYVAHGYPEADSSSLISPTDLDKYSGFPGYLSGRCRIERA
jgi:anaerobic selenocysteine-containing dehydrogenase